jgi:hypothetical protein
MDSCINGQADNPKIHKKVEKKMAEFDTRDAIAIAIHRKGAALREVAEMDEILTALGHIRRAASAGTESGTKETIQPQNTTIEQDLSIGRWVLVLRGPSIGRVGQVIHNDIPRLGTKVWLGGKPSPEWFEACDLKVIENMEVRMF